MMGGHIKPEGAACLPDPKRWYHEAAAFLAHTTSAISVGELQNVSPPDVSSTKTNAC